MQPRTAARVEKTLGFSREACLRWMKSRIDAYAEAFEGATHKLVWLGHSETFQFGEYRDMAWELTQYGWGKGCGTRDGIVERFQTKARNRSFGATVSPQGYMLVDETIPPMTLTEQAALDSGPDYSDDTVEGRLSNYHAGVAYDLHPMDPMAERIR